MAARSNGSSLMAERGIGGIPGQDALPGVACHCAFASQAGCDAVVAGSARAPTDGGGASGASGVGGSKRSPRRSSAIDQPSNSARTSCGLRGNGWRASNGDAGDQFLIDRVFSRYVVTVFGKIASSAVAGWRVKRFE
jgi:hypothetical protein